MHLCATLSVSGGGSLVMAERDETHILVQSSREWSEMHLHVPLPMSRAATADKSRNGFVDG